MSAQMVPYILATAGHVDHGKSALVRALTGTDPDRLPAEKERGITIELGFAELKLSARVQSSACRVQGSGLFLNSELRTLPSEDRIFQVGVVDVPGHEDFVKNMVAGVGSIDAALLVVAGDDGWMPQTEEHLQILQYLGIRRGVVALTKVDLVEDEAEVIAQVRHRLSGSGLGEAPIVPTSVVTGRGIDQLKLALAEVLAGTAPQADCGKPRLPVDRAFSLKGAGTIVTGTLTGGTIRRGQSVIIQPAGSAGRVRSVQTHGADVEQGRPGSRVALNLPDVAVASARGSRLAGTIARGDVVSIAGVGCVGRVVDVLLERSARRFDQGAPARWLKDDALVQIHHGSSAIPARVRFFGDEVDEDSHIPARLDAATGGVRDAHEKHGAGLATGRRAIARLMLDRAGLWLVGDRFIVRDWPEQQTLAGGIVLDAAPPAGTMRRRQALEAQRTLLQARAQGLAGGLDAELLVRSQLLRDDAIQRSEVVRSSRLAAGEVERAINQLVDRKAAIASGELVIDVRAWERLRAGMEKAIDDHHRAYPERGGIDLSELRRVGTSAGKAQRFAQGLADAIIESLCAAGFERSDGVMRRVSHQRALPPRLAPAGAQLRAMLQSGGLDPPSRKELVTGDAAMQALKFLIAQGEAIELGPEVVLSADAYAKARQDVRAHLQAHGQATVSELKNALNSSRRIMVPLLEKLDRDGVTRRQGDKRVLR
jgi:selenocysteine-specific elongation factor